jgi:heterodisulfide reductase subunit B
MKLSYYPGCTLKTKAKHFETSALACLDALGIEYEELERWNCCGAVYSLADDDLLHLLAPVRDLIRVKERGHNTVLTLCSMCYNTLARANHLMKTDEEKRKTVNMFMDEEPDYEGEVRVVHLLDYLRDDYGWDNLKTKVKQPLTGLKVAAYYGCTLLRPREVAIDHPDRPTLFEEFLQTLGAELVRFPKATECCGAYQVLSNPDVSLKVSFDILQSANQYGVEALALTCPLCDYNLERRQEAMLTKFEGASEMPIYYFTQLLAIALGITPDESEFKLNRASSLSLLRDKNLYAAKTA